MSGRPVYATFEKLGVPLDETALREGLRAIAVIPILHQDQVIGCLNVASHSLAEVPPYSRNVLETIASQIGGTIARLQVKQALLESEERIQNLIRHSSSMFYTHTPDHVLTYVSPQSRDILGCEPEQAGTRWQEYLSDHPGNIQGLEATERAIQTGRRQAPYELELVTRQGRKIWVRVDESPVVQDGKTVAIVGSVTDITERKRAEKLAREHDEHLLHVSRLNTLGEMASSLAHELNQPLSAILSYASASRRLIRPRNTDVARLRRDLDQVISQTKRAGEIIKRVRSFAQRQPANVRPTPTEPSGRSLPSFAPTWSATRSM
jgi:PAS domain S-box-containing protein